CDSLGTWPSSSAPRWRFRGGRPRRNLMNSDRCHNYAFRPHPAALAFAALAFAAGAARADAGELLKAAAGRAIPDEYIVFYKKDVATAPGTRAGALSAAQVALDMTMKQGGQILRVYEWSLQ